MPNNLFFKLQAVEKFKQKALAEQKIRLLPDQVLRIYHSPASTSTLAQLFHVSKSVIAQIKNCTGEYAPIVNRSKKKMFRQLNRRYYEKVVQF